MEINRVPLDHVDLQHAHETYEWVIANIKPHKQSRIVFSTNSMWVHAIIVPRIRHKFYGICIFYNDRYDGLMYDGKHKRITYICQSDSQQQVFDEVIIRLMDFI